MGLTHLIDRVGCVPLSKDRKIRSTLNMGKLLAAAIALIALEYLAIFFGFVTKEGAVLAPGAGVALIISLVWRSHGAFAVFAAYLVLFKLSTGNIMILDSALRAFVAFGAAYAMRHVHRTGWAQNRLNEWLNFFGCGVVASTIVYVAFNTLVLWAAGDTVPNFTSHLQTALAMMISILMVVAVAANFKEMRDGWKIWQKSLLISLALFFALIMLFVLVPLLTLRGVPGLMLLFGLPIALWIAKQPNSLPGATVTVFGAATMIWLMIDRVGTIDSPEVLQTVLYLFILIAIAQLFHAIELDRLATLKEIARSRDALQDMVILRNAEMSRMIRQSSRDTAARKRFRQTMTDKIIEPLKGLTATLSQAVEDASDANQKARLTALEAQLGELADNARQITNDAEFKGE